jgi:hypothetical protein
VIRPERLSYMSKQEFFGSLLVQRVFLDGNRTPAISFTISVSKHLRPSGMNWR